MGDMGLSRQMEMDPFSEAGICRNPSYIELHQRQAQFSDRWALAISFQMVCGSCEVDFQAAFAVEKWPCQEFSVPDQSWRNGTLSDYVELLS